MASTVRKDLFLARKLYSAIEKEDLWACDHFLKLGANPNLLLPEGLTALHLAAGWDADCAKAFLKLMLDHGGNPNVRSSDGLTPVHVSAMWGKTAVLRLLLQAGGNPHLTEEDGKNAWDLAREADQESAIRMLDYFDPLLKTKMSLSSLFLGEDLYLVKKSKSSDDVVLPKTPVFPPPSCCQHLPSDESTCSSPAETSFRIRKSTSETALSNSLNVSSWHLERHIPDMVNTRQFDYHTTSRSIPEVEPSDDNAQFDLQSVSESHDKLQQNESPGTISSSYTTCDEGPSWNLKKAIGQVVSDMLSPVEESMPLKEEETMYHSTNDNSSSTSTEEVVSCDPNTKHHLGGKVSRNPMHFDVSSFENLLNIATTEQPSFATSSPTGRHATSSPKSNTEPNKRGHPLFTSCEQKRQNEKKMGYTLTEDGISSGRWHPVASYQETKKVCELSEQSFASRSEVQKKGKDCGPTRGILVNDNKLYGNGTPNKHQVNLPPAITTNGHISGDDAKKVEKFVYSYPGLDISIVEHHFPSINKSSSSMHSSRSGESGDTTVIYNWQQFRSDCSDVSGSTLYDAVCVSPALERLSNSQIRAKLIAAGDSPGPVMDSTRELYLLRLARLQQKPLQKKVDESKENSPLYCKELMSVIEGRLNIHIMKDLECKMSKAFEQPKQAQTWREGQVKNCFNYLLLDPRVTKDLPGRAMSLSEADRMKTFLASIFYIGKGKRTRPYSHLYEAAQHMQKAQRKPTNKVQHILDIWSAGEGVVSLVCFQNVIPVEAYTREACMVETIGLDNVTNVRRGDYYGVVPRWTREKRQRLGAYLLYRAYNILLNEGERQIRPADM